MMKVLVLGGAGHIGNAIVRELLDRRYEVTATSRRPRPAANLAGLPVHYAPGDLDSPGQVDKWVAGHDIVVDAAAPYVSWLLPALHNLGRSPLDYAQRRTNSLLSAVRQNGARLAYVSSFVTLPRLRTGIAQWQAELVRRLHPYFAVKELIEARVVDAARNGLPAVVVNPTLCLGPWDLKEREYCIIPRLLRGEPAAAVDHILNVIDVRDVAAGLVAALEAERYGEPIALVGHNVTNEELFGWICELGGVSPPRVVAPMTLSLIATYWSEIALGVAGMRTPLPALATMLTSLYEPFSPSGAQCELGINPRPLSATLADSIAWYRSIGYC